MANTLITDDGKTEVLRLAFKNDSSHGAFNFMALGGETSTGAKDENFREIQDSSYHRVETEIENYEDSDKEVIISATFDETNLNSSSGELITEIGLVNSANKSQGETFFAYCEVPEIVKDDTITLKYTVIIEIE